MKRGICGIMLVISVVACIDGLTGLPEAIHTVFPETCIQLCIVHIIRNSTRFVSFKDRKTLCADLKKIHSAASERERSQALDAFTAA